MLSAVMPVSEASLSPPPPPPPLSPPPQAARVEATVAAARMVTRRREGLDNCSPLCGWSGLRCPDGGGGGSWIEGPASSPPAGTGGRAPGPQAEQSQPGGSDDSGGGEDH